ncbi:hypothetical protein AB3S75_013134 [Citrus x aurantiifolia]
MADSSSRGVVDLHTDYAPLHLEEDEESSLEVSGEEEEDNGAIKIDSRYWLVGRFLTDKVINFTAMKNIIAAL